MENQKEIFELDFEQSKIKVHKVSIGGQIIFRVAFQDMRPLLVLTRSTNANAVRWWTSIPEGRQKEAEAVGPLIEAYYKKNQ